MPEIKKTAEDLAIELNAKVDTFKEMVEKSATVEALNEAVKSFDEFKEKNDTEPIQENIFLMHKHNYKHNKQLE